MLKLEISIDGPKKRGFRGQLRYVMRRIDETPKGTSLAETASIDVGLKRSGSAVGLPDKSQEK
jgi:hypothetical protein